MAGVQGVKIIIPGAGVGVKTIIGGDIPLSGLSFFFIGKTLPFTYKLL